MPSNARFWRNLTLIGLVHVAFIVGLIRWSRETKNSNGQSIVWMNGGAGDGTTAQIQATAARKSANTASPRPETKTEALKKEELEEERPVLASVNSEIQLPAAKPTPASIPTATPARTPKPSPTPKPTPRPKPTPKPKPSPKKTILAKASPKPSPKLKPAPTESEENDQQANIDAERKRVADAVSAKSNVESKPTTKAVVNTQTGTGKGTSTGLGGRTGGAGGESKFGWYGSMLHDRFYSEWVQPTTVASPGAKNSVLVKIRIEKGGRVSSFEIIRPSGNTDLDESVKAIANRVAQVEPLPAGLGNGDHYDVKINFELNSE